MIELLDLIPILDYHTCYCEASGLLISKNHLRLETLQSLLGDEKFHVEFFKTLKKIPGS